MSVTELLAADPLWVGDVQVVGRLGEGGMGVVYLGRRRNGEAVAVKVMRADLAAHADLRRRFALEVQALTELGGIYTAEVLGADVAAAQPWMVMEYVQGSTLADHITRNGAMAADEFEAFARSLLRAARAIAGAGVVHRDLKPSNVVLSPDGVRLLDFGVARFRGEPPDTAKAGSLTWMAPEQLDPGQDDSACDIHALGMLLYFAASGRHVYGYGDPESVAWRIRNATPQLVDLPTYCAAWQPLISACLAKNPADRPSLAAIHRRVDPAGAAAADRILATSSSPPTTAAVSRGGSPAAPAGRAGVVQPTGVVLPPGSARRGGAQDAAAPATSDHASVGRQLRKVRRLAILVVALWFVGWTVGIWPLGGPLAPAQATACVESAQPADFASGSAFLRSGGGVVSQSLLGYFPGPFGEVRTPTDAVACQIGKAVTVECSQPTLAEGAVVGCRASDANGQQVPVNVTRVGDTWQWVMV